MMAIISFKPEQGKLTQSPHRIADVVMVFTDRFSTNFVTRRKKIQTFQNCDLQNIFLDDMGK